jgi:tRNA-2-methylthio-N6-dimethylallyladenosine synthase
MNFHDSEKLRGQVEALGYAETSDEEDADLILLNTCSVRDKADRKVLAYLGGLRRRKEANPDLILAVCGCLAQQLRRELFERVPHLDMVLGPQALPNLPRHLEAVREGREQVLDAVLRKRRFDDQGAPIRRNAPPKAWVTVQEGCDKFCAYCLIPYTRGRELNRPLRQVIAEVEELAATGYLEVELLGQNVNCWREDGAGFADLLLAVAEVPGIRRVRFITSHPAHFDDRIIDAMTHESVCPHVHLPVQSGSDRMLERMKREMTRADFLGRVERLRAAVPDAAISTDIIVGFVGEEPEDHDDTLRLLREVEFDFIYSFLYSPRPLSPAAGWEETVPKEEKLRRLLEVNALQAGIQLRRQRACVGSVAEVLVDGSARRDPGEACGRTPQWRVVNFPGDAAALHGRLVPVRITEARQNSLRGVLEP